MPDKKDKLNSKLTKLRDDEREKRLRASGLAKEMEERSLTSDESAELGEIETALESNTEEQRNIQRALKIGNFSSEINEDLGLNDKELRNFSIIKLIAANARNASQKDRDNATLELEASSAIEKRLGIAAQGNFLPMEVMGEWRGCDFDYEAGNTNPVETRDLDSNTFSQAAAFIGTDFRPQQMIPLLRNSMALARAGVTFLDGLVGDVAIPKHTGTATTGWVGRDGGVIGESNQTVGMVTLTPRTLGVFTDYSRQLNLQSSISVENFIRNDLMASMALETDRAYLFGSGSNGEPAGLNITTGIGAQTFAGAGDPTRVEVVGMRTDLSSANALLGNPKYITNSTVAANMLNRVVDAGSGIFLLSFPGIGVNRETGMVIGRELIESNQVAANQMFFGNWADMLVGSWGGFDLLVDPFTGATAGNIRLLVFQSVDMAVRHAESFTLGGA